jgi:aspartyl-tRNA synthetase
VRGIRIAGGGELSRKQVDALEELARGAGASGLLRLKRDAVGEISGPLARHLAPSDVERLGLEPGDLALFVAGPDHVSNPALDRVRQEAARLRGMIPDGASAFLWVTEFPLFERDPESRQLGAVHHPFTSPALEDLALLEGTPERARAIAYDVVLNGTELGGGSIRISDPELQRRIFGLLGIDEETARQRFGFLLEGLRSGAPPHGGIALGFDRIAMLLSGAGSLRDVIAFPKTTQASALFEGAPSPVPEGELRELHVRVEGRGDGGKDRSSDK